MKIAQLCPYDIDRTGGVQRHIKALSQELQNRGHDVIIIAPGPAPDKPTPGVVYSGIQYATGWSGTRFEISAIGVAERRRLLNFLKDWNVDIVHFHTIWVPMMPFQVFLGLECATAATFHDTPPDTKSGHIWFRTYQIWSHWFLNRLDGAIAVSKAPARHLYRGPCGVNPVILPPCVNLEDFRAIERTRMDGTRDCFEVLFVGRFEPRKGVTTLLAAWTLLLEKTRNDRGSRKYRLTIAGSGELENEILEARDKFGGDRVTVVKKPTDGEIPELMRNADLLVAPSPYGESFGIVLVEALAGGLPVVAADNHGYVTVLTGPGRDCLVKAGQPHELADAIIRMAQDAGLRETISNWGREHAMSFDVRNTVADFESFFAGAIERFRNRSA